MPPAVTYSTRLYRLPTCLPVHKSSLTESMTLVEPAQAKVATTVLPKGGFSGLNSLLSSVPLVPLKPHRAIPDAVAAAVTPGTAVRWLGGVTSPEQPATSRAMTSNRLDVVRPPCGKDATWRPARHSVCGPATRRRESKVGARGRRAQG